MKLLYKKREENGMNYSTQMDAARKNIITQEMEYVAKEEKIEVEKLRNLIAEGKVIIPANKNHINIKPKAIGVGTKTKVNVNLGISKDCFDIQKELEKAKCAIELEADAIMDLSSFGKTKEFRRELVIFHL